MDGKRLKPTRSADSEENNMVAHRITPGDKAILRKNFCNLFQMKKKNAVNSLDLHNLVEILE